jgi:CubicO group peptidase (beta-lactamase class C family)
MRSWIKLALPIIFSFMVPMIASAQEADLNAQVERYLEPYVSSKNFTGVVLVAKGDKLLVNRAYGYANESLRVPNTPSTRFHIASISKPFTAAAILLLQERGLLGTSDKISKYLPGFPRSDQITVLNLLTHTSGIVNVNNLPEYEKAQRFPQTPATLIQLFKDKPLDFEPGAKYAYSNSNYNILAFIIEQVGKRPYGEFLRANIFVPLGLPNTGHDGNAADIVPNSASGYQPRGNDELENASGIDWSAKTGNGSLYSTSADLLKFVRAYAQGKLLKPATVAELWVEKPGNNYGWFVRKAHGELAVASNGRSPGFTSSLEYYPGRDLVVIVLSNSYSPVSQSPIAEDLAAMALGQSVSVPEKIEAVSISPDEWRGLEGTYSFGSDFFRPNARVHLESHGQNPFLNWGNNFETALTPVGKGEFLDRQFWARLKVKSSGTLLYSTGGRDFELRRTEEQR